ncbi:hypothetical protein [Polaromonas sp. JS666]|uniref:hypothetical protein n=1 Tax=Polaromonas sp. (strain JS666 / ATCC BAA-500) TaxID=296591 RepID=UPI0000534E32|nr:hypothetical protein [Polaromonas sp. JS666]ABE45262.1 hypothetical protein Bpro_3352 [Polaromonas sp. JS666]
MDKSDFDLAEINLEQVVKIDYDLVVYALGYESRATKLLELVGQRKNRAVAFGFNYGQGISFEKNTEAFSRQEVKQVKELSDSQFQAEFERELKDAITNKSDGHIFRLLVDISCFNRFRLASVVSSIAKFAEHRPIAVDFFYSIAKFNAPPIGHITNSIVDAVHPSFAGWSRIPANPTAAVIGLGYEQGQALGVVEYLQANPVWVFPPQSGELRYFDAVNQANSLLLDELPKGKNVPYKVEQPLDTFRAVEGLTRGLLLDYNVVLVPFGPKIFVLIALLAAWRHRSIAVWRVSPGTAIEPTEREASEHYSLIRVNANSGLLKL